MPKINIDLRFVDVLYELDASAKYIAAFEGQLPNIVRQEEEKAFERIRKEQLSIDDGEADLIRRELYALTDDIFPRFYRGTILVTIWSILESAIIDIAKELQTERHKTLSIDDLKGDFLERTKKYYKHVLDFPLNVSSKEWQCINMLKVLRNAIAHCNGRIESITKEKDINNIKKWEKEKRGISTKSGSLIFSKGFIEEIHYNVNTFLTHLISEVKKKEDKG